MEEDINNCLDWTGCNGIRPEVGDGLTEDEILLIVEGDKNLGVLAEILSGGVIGEEKVPDDEQKVHEGPELDRSTVTGALRVFTGPEAEVEANGDQIGDVGDSGVRGAGCRGDDGVNNYQGDGLFSSDGGSLSP